MTTLGITTPGITSNTRALRAARKPARPKLPRTAMPEQPARQRACNFEEVTLGYDDEMAALEVESTVVVCEAVTT